MNLQNILSWESDGDRDSEDYKDNTDIDNKDNNNYNNSNDFFFILKILSSHLERFSRLLHA